MIHYIGVRWNDDRTAPWVLREIEGILRDNELPDSAFIQNDELYVVVEDANDPLELVGEILEEAEQDCEIWDATGYIIDGEIDDDDT